MAQNVDRELMQACGIANDGGLGRACRAVAAGADVGRRDLEGYSPLSAAALAGSVRTCEMLIRRGAAVNLPLGDGTVALHAACTCFEGNLDVVRLLVASGADVSVADDDGSTPLHYACEAGHTELAGLLLALGADPCRARRDGWAPLHVACQHGCLALVELLLAKGADPCCAVADGATPAGGYLTMAELLLSYGAPIDQASTQPAGVTALRIACIFGHLPVVSLLLSKGARISSPGYDSQVLLEEAAEGNHAEVVHLLLAHGAALERRCQCLGRSCQVCKDHAFIDRIQASTAVSASSSFTPASASTRTPAAVVAPVQPVETTATASAGPTTASAPSPRLSALPSAPASAATDPIKPASTPSPSSVATTATVASIPSHLPSPSAAAAPGSPAGASLTADLEALHLSTAHAQDSRFALPSSPTPPAAAASSPADAVESAPPATTRPPQQCARCGAPKSAAVKLSKCSGCQAVRYCSAACQQLHWREGGHKQQCKLLRVSTGQQQG